MGYVHRCKAKLKNSQFIVLKSNNEKIYKTVCDVLAKRLKCGKRSWSKIGANNMAKILSAKLKLIIRFKVLLVVISMT